jgi:hypothetical protein
VKQVCPLLIPYALQKFIATQVSNLARNASTHAYWHHEKFDHWPYSSVAQNLNIGDADGLN